ncbi:MAG: RAMP superfamily CRISPR-associated protein [Candidatus Caldarchaeales archaeon]
MKKIVFCLRPIGLLSLGHAHPRSLGPDIPFATKPVASSGGVVRVPYVPGPSVKGALRSAASRVARAFGFTSCGEGLSKSMRSCDVCALFGEPGVDHPKLFFSDFLPDGEVRLHTLTRVMIDDASSTVSEHVLFTVECAVRPTVFKGEVSFRELSERELKLLLLSMAELRLDRFGRSSSVDLKIEKVEGFVVPVRLKGIFGGLSEWLWA